MNKKKAENKKESLGMGVLTSDEMLENVSGGWRTGRFIDPLELAKVTDLKGHIPDIIPAYKEKMLNTEKN